MVLAQKLPHDQRGRVADVQTLHLAELWNRERQDIGIIGRIETEPVFLMSEYKGAAERQRVGMNRTAVLRCQGEEVVMAGCQGAVDAGKIFVKPRRYPLERPHRRGRVEEINADQVNLAGPESVGAAEYLADIESRLETVQYNNEAVRPMRRQAVRIFLAAEPFSGGDALLLKLAAKLS